ncbi:MAG: GumC family protein [bacterium]
MNSRQDIPGTYDLNSRSGHAGLDWRNFWQILKRRKWYVIIPTILFGLGGFYKALSIIPIYDSSTTILVSGGKLITGSVRDVIPGVSISEEIAAVRRFVTSGECITQLINTLGLKKEPELHQRAVKLGAQLPDMTTKEIENMLFIEQVRNYIKVQTRGRDIVQISASHRNPHTAYILAKTLAQVFIDESQKRQLGGIRGVRDFSEEQLAIYEEKLRESEERLKLYQQGILKSQIDNSGAGRQTLERLKSDVAAMEVSIQDKQERLGFLKSKLVVRNFDPKRIMNSKISGLQKGLFSKIDDMMRMLNKFTWKDPQVIAYNRDMNEYRNRIRGEIENHVSAVYTEGDQGFRNMIVEWNMSSLDLDILTYEKNALSDLIRTLEKHMTRKPTHQMILNNLQQEVQQNRQLYLRFLEQSRGTQIEEQIQRKDAEFKLQIIDLAKKPLYPKGSSRLRLLGLTLLFGLGFGIAIIYAFEYMDQSYKNIDDVEKDLNLTVWGVVPNLQEFTASVWRRDGMMFLLVIFGTAIAATLIFIMKKGNLI